MNTLFALPLLFACVGDVGEGKVAAEISDAPVAEEKVEAPKADGNSLTIDIENSSIKALGAKITATHPIDFSDWSGSVSVDGDNVTDINFEVKMETLEADHPKLTQHLKNEDFFDVSNHPTAGFDGTTVTAGSDAEGMTHTVQGALTIRGNTKTVTFPANITIDETAVTANTEFTINRQDFGVVYPGKPDDLVQDNVVLTVSIQAPRS